MEKSDSTKKQDAEIPVNNDCYSEKYFFKDDGVFPNNLLPVIHYRNVLELPRLFPARYVEKLFEKNGWTNTWEDGIYDYHHYHSNTHEVLGFLKGGAKLILGGDKGMEIDVKKGDVLIIPAGVAHKRTEDEEGEGGLRCIGAYPEGIEYDMNYGKSSERPVTDSNIRLVAFPQTDPVFGKEGGIFRLWKTAGKSIAGKRAPVKKKISAKRKTAAKK